MNMELGRDPFRPKFQLGENLLEAYYGDFGVSEGYIDGVDIRIAETTKRDAGFYTLTADTQVLGGPMKGASMRGKHSKGTVFQSSRIEINGYLKVNLPEMYGENYSSMYIPVTLLQPTQNQGKRYIRYGVITWRDGKSLELKRFDEVTLLTEKGTTVWVEIDGETYPVPKKSASYHKTE